MNLHKRLGILRLGLSETRREQKNIASNIFGGIGSGLERIELIVKSPMKHAIVLI